jgi:hypothetical protein
MNHHSGLNVPKSIKVIEEENARNKKQLECSHSKYMCKCSNCGLVLGSELGRTTESKSEQKEILL